MPMNLLCTRSANPFNRNSKGSFASSDSCIRIWICTRFIVDCNTVYDNALEFLENVLKSQLRAILVPLLDGKVSPKQRAAIAQRFVRAKVGNREQRSPAIIPG